MKHQGSMDQSVQLNKSLKKKKNSSKIKKYPIPAGESSYCLAKRAEYLEKNLEKAKLLYEQAIKENERVSSAIKDLAGVLHQQGKTLDAVLILEQNEILFEDKQKYNNLLNNLKKQIEPSGNAAIKNVLISNVCSKSFIEKIDIYFQSKNRITSIENINQNQVLITFNSHSSARKAMDNFTAWELCGKVEWVNSNLKATGVVIPPKKPLQLKNTINQILPKEERKVNPPPPQVISKQEIKKDQIQQVSSLICFSYIFAIDNDNKIFFLPLDKSFNITKSYSFFNEDPREFEECIETKLMHEINFK